ncbi:MAG: LCP family protein [Patescibacteria group bacterium]
MYSIVNPQEPRESYDAPPRQRRSLFKLLAWLIALAVVGYIGYVGYHFASAYRTIVIDSNEGASNWERALCLFKKCADSQKEIEDDQNPVPPEEANRFDILILGIRGEDDLADGGLLTDTMMLLSVDKATGRTALVSLPRDLYIDMKGTLVNGSVFQVKGKLNEVYERGYENQQGLAFASQMISRLTGVRVDKAVLFDFKAFGEIVDALGGVDVYLDKPFSEPKQWGYPFTLPAGANHLNGEQALYYVRSRYSSSDFDRARRQQQVMFAMKKRATELGFLANPVKVSNLLTSLKGNLKTNIQLWEVGDMVNLAKKLSANTPKTSVISTDNLLYETKGIHGEYILLPKGENFTLLRDYFKTVLAQ